MTKEISEGPRCFDCNQLLMDTFHTGVFFHVSPCIKVSGDNRCKNCRADYNESPLGVCNGFCSTDCEIAWWDANRIDPRPATLASLITTDGTTSIIGIYHCLMTRNAASGRTIDFDDPQTVEIKRVEVKGNHILNVERLQREYATAEFPVVDWSW